MRLQAVIRGNISLIFTPTVCFIGFKKMTGKAVIKRSKDTVSSDESSGSVIGERRVSWSVSQS
jgi:hypothetical protein